MPYSSQELTDLACFVADHIVAGLPTLPPQMSADEYRDVVSTALSNSAIAFLIQKELGIGQHVVMSRSSVQAAMKDAHAAIAEVAKKFCIQRRAEMKRREEGN